MCPPIRNVFRRDPWPQGKWKQPQPTWRWRQVLTDTRVCCTFLTVKPWGRDILKRDYRRICCHKQHHRSRGHTAAEALFQGELQAVRAHTSINVQTTGYYSCPHAQTRLGLVNYSKTRRDLAADRYPARVAESVTLLLLYNPKDTQQQKPTWGNRGHGSSAPHSSRKNKAQLKLGVVHSGSQSGKLVMLRRF